jgi:hypothetical protein
MKSVAGENTDLILKGEKVHVQTEDWADNGYTLVSRVFKHGSVIKTFKLPYDKINQVEIDDRRHKALQKFHQFVIEKLYAE